MYASVKLVGCMSLVEEVTLIGGLWKCFLVTPQSKKYRLHLQIFRPVQLVVLAAESKTDLGFGAFIV